MLMLNNPKLLQAKRQLRQLKIIIKIDKDDNVENMMIKLKI